MRNPFQIACNQKLEYFGSVAYMLTPVVVVYNYQLSQLQPFRCLVASPQTLCKDGVVYSRIAR